jgi:phage tail-like protein
MAILNFEYPLSGFHFLVVFELFPQTPVDVRFQEVSGLSVSMNTESVTEGGQNRYVHKLPTRTSYTDLVLKRGLFTSSLLQEWIRKATEEFDIKPVNLLVSLLDDDHLPVFNWHVCGAYPLKWDFGNLNAEQGQVAIESITLTYNYFDIISPASAIGGALSAAGSISVSI